MLHLIALVVALPPLYILFLALKSYVDGWIYVRKAAARGCRPAYLRHYKLPGGFDMIKRTFDADVRHQIPNEFERICREDAAGKSTFRQYFFGKPLFFTIDPRNIQAILATQFDDFELGPTRRANFFPLLGDGIFTADGAAWTHGRGLLRPQFARNQVADLALEEHHVQDVLLHLPTDESGWTSPANLQPIFFRFTLDSATEFLFGESVYSQLAALPDSHPARAQLQNNTGLDLIETGKAFDRAIHAIGKRARFADNYWMYNPKSFRDDTAIVHKFADYFVNRALSSDLEKAGKNDKYVFLTELTKTTRDPIELRSQLLNIFLAGRDTTAGLLSWVFWVLARHPEILRKLRAEILQNFGPYDFPRNISFSTLKTSTYLQNVLHETLRLYPSVPLNGRRAVRDTTIPFGGGPDGTSPVFIPKGVAVDYSVHIMHRRKDLWGEDAEEFKPERWIGRKHGWEFLPFNGGPRICLGQQFALTEAGYVIVRLLQRFDAVENLDGVTGRGEELYQYTVTTAPWEVNVRLREARD